MKDVEGLVHQINLYLSELTEQLLRQFIYILQALCVLVMLILQTVIFLLHGSTLGDSFSSLNYHQT